MTPPGGLPGPERAGADPASPGSSDTDPTGGPTPLVADEELDAEAQVVERLLDSAVAGAEQSAEDAVAEAVGLAKQFEAERDEYLDLVRRVQAEFENYKRRVEAQRGEQRAQAAADLIRELLPVLDACEAAVDQGHSDVEPVRDHLLLTLEKQGLVAVQDAGVPFDPNVHEAVLHEEGDGDAEVIEVLRTGYLWNDRVVRAAMVKVRG